MWPSTRPSRWTISPANAAFGFSLVMMSAYLPWGTKTDVLAVGLLGDNKTHVLGQLAGFRLGHAP